MKFFKWFFFGLGFWIILIMFITYPINTRAGAVSSVTLSDKTVTFYSPNGREEIYTLNVPYGVSLQQVQDSNLIDNSFFYGVESATYVNSNTYNDFNVGGGWHLQANTSDASEIILNSNPSITLTRTGSVGYTYLNRPINITANTTYYITFKSNNMVYNFSYYLGSIPTTYTANTIVPFNSEYGFWVRFEFFNNNNYINIGFSGNNVSDNHSFNIEYLSVSELNYEYFDSSYLELLYFNAGYDISNLSWSESPYTSIPFTYDDFIEFNTNLYPTKIVESFSLTKSWQSLLTGLDGNYMTFNVFQDLVNAFQDLTNPNNLQINNFLDIFKALWFLLKSVFVLLYNVLMLVIAPFVDLFRMIVSALFSGLDFWIFI